MDNYRYLVLPPEASTNWIFDDSVLFNLVVGLNRLIMDRRDYHRYRRLAGLSDVDFHKYFTLTLLATQRFIRFLDYKNWYTPEAITKSLERLGASKIIDEPYRFVPNAIQAYGRYGNYVDGKRPFLEIATDAHGLRRLAQERASTDHDLVLLNSGKGDTRHLVAYLSRLATKLLAAEAIAVSFRVAGYDADIFDSMEYSCGTDILSEGGIELQTKHAAEMFEVSGGQVRVAERIPGPVRATHLQHIFAVRDVLRRLDRSVTGRAKSRGFLSRCCFTRASRLSVSDRCARQAWSGP